MTANDAIIAVWLVAGVRALIFALRKHRNALLDDEARRAEGTNGAQLVVTSGRVRSARQAIAQSLLIATAALLAVADRLDGPGSSFGLLILILITGVPVIFQWRLHDDNKRDDRLLQLLRRPVSTRERSGDP